MVTQIIVAIGKYSIIITYNSAILQGMYTRDVANYLVRSEIICFFLEHADLGRYS